MLEKNLIALLFAFFAATGARAQTPPNADLVPLQEAFRKSSEQFDHWAFTETTRIVADKGHNFGETIVRFDPSQPYAEQFKPIQVQGHVPSKSDFRTYRKEGEQREKWLEKLDAEKAAGNDDGPRVEVNGSAAVIDFAHGVLVGEQGGLLIYQVPLRDVGAHPLPIEKLDIHFRVTKADHVFASANMKLLSPLRFKLIVRLKEGQLEVGWSKVKLGYPPLITTERVDFKGSVLFVSLSGSESIVRSNFKQVTPYSDRFRVKMGPLKVLSF